MRSLYRVLLSGHEDPTISLRNLPIEARTCQIEAAKRNTLVGFSN
jgi:hypothetical protein